MTGFGTLMIFDCFDVNENLNNRYSLDNFIDEVVKRMDMKKVGKPTVEWFEDNEFNRNNDLIGYSYCQIISLSSITIHCCSLSRRMYIDIFTCCKVDEVMIELIQSIIKLMFRPRVINSTQINR
jgi:S-adenosylmethionine/arginine decarboxylase-like enzyme